MAIRVRSSLVAAILGLMAVGGSAWASEDESQHVVFLDVLEVRGSSEATDFLAEGELELPVSNDALFVTLDLEYLSKEGTFDSLEVEASYRIDLAEEISASAGAYIDASEDELIAGALFGFEFVMEGDVTIEASALFSVAPLLKFGISKETSLTNSWTLTPFVDLELPLASEETQERFSQDELLEIGTVLEFQGVDEEVEVEFTADVLADEPSLKVGFVGISTMEFLGDARLDLELETTFPDRTSVFDEVIEIEIGGRVVLLNDDNGIHPYFGIRYINDLTSSEDAETFGVVGALVAF